MSTHRIVLTDTQQQVALGDWQLDPDVVADVAAVGAFSLRQEVLHGGRQEGCEVITLACDTGLTIRLCPTRGMSVLDVTSVSGARLGWASPIDEVVHPQTLSLESCGGTGWGQGFNEMMVRCGYAWGGHPVVSDGMLYTLHGRAGNLIASRVEVIVEPGDPCVVRVRGLLKERAFKSVTFDVWTEMRYEVGSQTFTLRDELINRDDYPRDFQAVYHSNIGVPMLGAGARFIAPIKDISPFNDAARPGLSDWAAFEGPTAGFDEMTFNIEPYACDKGHTVVAVHDADKAHGMAIRFDTRVLPYLSLWKNLDTLAHGYVVGVEPGTCFCYPVTIEREQGRVRSLAGGASVVFALTYQVLNGKDEIDALADEVQQIQGDRPTTVTESPRAYE